MAGEEEPTSPSRFWAALNLVRMALESVAPAGVVPSRETVQRQLGPEPVHEGEALAKAIIEMAERLNGPSGNRDPLTQRD